MHKNLIEVQREFILGVGDAGEILEIESKKPVVLACMYIAEAPISISEISKRCSVDEDTVKTEVERLFKKQILSKTDDERYELNPDADKVIIQNIKTKIDLIHSNNKNKIEKIKNLMTSNKDEFDNYDLLMAKYLKSRMKKLELIHNFVEKRIFLWNFLSENEPKNETIKKIEIQ